MTVSEAFQTPLLASLKLSVRDRIEAVPVAQEVSGTKVPDTDLFLSGGAGYPKFWSHPVNSEFAADHESRCSLDLEDVNPRTADGGPSAACFITPHINRVMYGTDRDCRNRMSERKTALLVRSQKATPRDPKIPTIMNIKLLCSSDSCPHRRSRVSDAFIVLRDCVYPESLSEEVSGPEGESGETFEAWKVRMAATSEMSLESGALKTVHFLEDLIPAWRSDSVHLRFGGLSASQQQKITYHRVPTNRISPRISLYAPYNFGIKHGWLNSNRIDTEKRNLLTDWGKHPEPVGSGLLRRIPIAGGGAQLAAC
ncbi:hypothetical protein FB451DRAFT_1162407 [Mycena latifolia]|nr:hypothetical protein FB451DRAFT_1162407 [Mycena latifolia]